MKRRRNYEQGHELVREFEQSGQSHKDFCAGRGMAACTLTRWRQRVQAAAGGGGLLEVKIKGEPAREGLLRISWPCGVQVEVESSAAGSVLLGRLHQVFQGGGGSCSR